jgi:hypothetical protein
MLRLQWLQPDLLLRCKQQCLLLSFIFIQLTLSRLLLPLLLPPHRQLLLLLLLLLLKQHQQLLPLLLLLLLLPPLLCCPPSIAVPSPITIIYAAAPALMLLLLLQLPLDLCQLLLQLLVTFNHRLHLNDSLQPLQHVLLPLLLQPRSDISCTGLQSTPESHNRLTVRCICSRTPAAAVTRPTSTASAAACCCFAAGTTS